MNACSNCRALPGVTKHAWGCPNDDDAAREFARQFADAKLLEAVVEEHF